MADPVLYQNEVCFILGLLSPSGETLKNYDAALKFRLLTAVVRYEQLVFEKYLCDPWSSRYVDLDPKIRIARKRCLRLMPHPFNTHPIRFSITYTAHLEHRIQRFARCTARGPSRTTQATLKSLKRMAAVISHIRPHVRGRKIKSESRKRTVPMTRILSHSGTRADVQPPLPLYHRQYQKVSISRRFTCAIQLFSRALCIAVAGAAKCLNRKLRVIDAAFLIESCNIAEDLFRDAIYLKIWCMIIDGQLEMRCTPSNNERRQSEQFLSTAYSQGPLRPEFLERHALYVGGKDPIAVYYAAIKEFDAQDSASLCEAMSDFFLQWKLGLLVAGEVVFSVVDTHVRGIIDASASVDQSHWIPCNYPEEFYTYIKQRVQGPAKLYLMDRCPVRRIIPRPPTSVHRVGWTYKNAAKYQQTCDKMRSKDDPPEALPDFPSLVPLQKTLEDMVLWSELRRREILYEDVSTRKTVLPPIFFNRRRSRKTGYRKMIRGQR